MKKRKDTKNKRSEKISASAFQLNKNSKVVEGDSLRADRKATRKDEVDLDDALQEMQQGGSKSSGGNKDENTDVRGSVSDIRRLNSEMQQGEMNWDKNQVDKARTDRNLENQLKSSSGQINTELGNSLDAEIDHRLRDSRFDQQRRRSSQIDVNFGNRPPDEGDLDQRRHVHQQPARS